MWRRCGRRHRRRARGRRGGPLIRIGLLARCEFGGRSMGGSCVGGEDVVILVLLSWCCRSKVVMTRERTKLGVLGQSRMWLWTQIQELWMSTANATIQGLFVRDSARRRGGFESSQAAAPCTGCQHLWGANSHWYLAKYYFQCFSDVYEVTSDAYQIPTLGGGISEMQDVIFPFEVMIIHWKWIV